MKKFLEPFKPFIPAMLVVALVTALGLFLPDITHTKASAAPGQTVFNPNFYTAISNYNSLSIPSNSVVTFSPTTNQNILCPQNKGETWIASFTSTNANTGTITIYFDGTADGNTNHWTTNQHVAVWNIPIIPNSTWTASTNFGRDTVNNLRSIFPTIASNNVAFGNPIINWLEESHGNQ